MLLPRVTCVSSLSALFLVACMALLGVGEVATGHDSCWSEYERGDDILYWDGGYVTNEVSSVGEDYVFTYGNKYVDKNKILGKLIDWHNRVRAEVSFREEGKTFLGTVKYVYSRGSERSFVKVYVKAHSILRDDGSKQSVSSFGRYLGKEQVRFLDQQCRRRRDR